MYKLRGMPVAYVGIGKAFASASGVLGAVAYEYLAARLGKVDRFIDVDSLANQLANQPIEAN